MDVGDDGSGGSGGGHVGRFVGGEGVGTGEVREVEIVLDEVVLEGREVEGAAGELLDERVVDVAVPERTDAWVGEEPGHEVIADGISGAAEGMEFNEYARGKREGVG